MLAPIRGTNCDSVAAGFIVLQLTLWLDAVSYNSNDTLEAVPEPAVLGLSALLALAGRRRRVRC